MDLPFISLDYGYFLNISASLGADEAGAWLMLYSQAWGRGGSLQDDDDRLCRLCRLTKRKWLQIRPVVLSDWRSDSGQLFNDVLTKEYARALKNKSEKVKAGKARQNGKSQTNQGNNDSTAQAALNASPSPSPSPSPTVDISNDISPIEKEKYTKEKPEEETTHAQANQPARPENNQPDAGANPVAPPAKHDKAEPVGFELFWKNFPSQRKGSRDRALRAYRLALKRASAEKINLAVLQYAKSQEVRTGYAKGAAAWLNDDRYETDYSVNPKNGKRVETSRSESREVF